MCNIRSSSFANQFVHISHNLLISSFESTIVSFTHLYTYRWESGVPSAAAKAARTARYSNARTQMTSSFPPQKRLTLERKSPVTRLDINAPTFEKYRTSLPGLANLASSAGNPLK